MFLYLEKSTSKVICSPEGMTRPEVQKVYSGDKSKGKDQFNAVITGIYWIYRPRNIYSNRSLADRIKIVNETYLSPTTQWEKLVEIPGVKKLIDCYIELTSTINDRALDNLRNDFESLMAALNDVPPKVDIEIPKGVDVLGEDGKTHRTKQSAKISVPTFEQKSDLWTQFQTFAKILKTVQADLKLEAEERVKSGNDDVYLYDEILQKPIKTEQL